MTLFHDKFSELFSAYTFLSMGSIIFVIKKSFFIDNL